MSDTRLTHSVTGKFTSSEQRLLEQRAAACGLKLGQYVRRELLATLSLPHDTQVLLGRVEALEEILLRIFSAWTQGTLEASEIRKIQADVLALRSPSAPKVA